MLVVHLFHWSIVLFCYVWFVCSVSFFPPFLLFSSIDAIDAFLLFSLPPGEDKKKEAAGVKAVLLARDSARLKAELAGTGGKVRGGKGT